MSIKQFLKREKDPKKLFQSYVKEDLYIDLRRRLKEQKITHRMFTEAAIRQFLKEEY